jgi:hypothetical protein
MYFSTFQVVLEYILGCAEQNIPVYITDLVLTGKYVIVHHAACVE